VTAGRYFLATVVSGLSMWVIAGLWHNLIMPGLYADRHASHDGIGLLLVAYLVLSGMMVYLYGQLSSVDGLAGGLWFGALVGILWVLPHGLAMAGAHGDSIAYVVRNTAWHVVEQALGGAVIVTIISRTRNDRKHG